MHPLFNLNTVCVCGGVGGDGGGSWGVGGGGDTGEKRG